VKQKITLLYFILMLVPGFSFSQEEKIIQGKIIIKDATPRGVHIINLVNEKEAISDAAGNFNIAAKVDDVLVFSAIHLDLMRKIIETADYDSGIFSIVMTSKINALEVVEIDNRINAVSLGIIPKDIKPLTPAERRLYASQSSPLDDLLNLLSGRKKMLLDNVATEKKEFLLQKLDGLFSDDFYTQQLCIEKDKIPAFHYYVVEDGKFADAANSKNKFMAELLIIELAEKFNSLQNGKN